MNAQRFEFLKTESQNAGTFTITAQEAQDIYNELLEADKTKTHLTMALKLLSTCTSFSGQSPELILKMIAFECDKAKNS
jgi:hypothetical protein